MNVITIPEKLARNEDLIAIPRQEYEEFLALKKIIPMMKPTREETAVIKRGEKEIKEGKYVEWKKFKRELARRHN